MIGSTYDQDWSYVENILKDFNIKYDIRREIRKNGNKFSSIRFWGIESIAKWGKFIYLGYNEDKMGMERKYEKYSKLIIPKPSHRFVKTVK